MKFKQRTTLLFAVLLLVLLPFNVFSAGNKEAASNAGTKKAKVTFFHYFSGTLAGGIGCTTILFFTIVNRLFVHP